MYWIGRFLENPAAVTAAVAAGAGLIYLGGRAGGEGRKEQIRERDERLAARREEIRRRTGR